MANNNAPKSNSVSNNAPKANSVNNVAKNIQNNQLRNIQLQGEITEGLMDKIDELRSSNKIYKYLGIISITLVPGEQKAIFVRLEPETLTIIEDNIVIPLTFRVEFPRESSLNVYLTTRDGKMYINATS